MASVSLEGKFSKLFGAFSHNLCHESYENKTLDTLVVVHWGLLCFSSSLASIEYMWTREEIKVFLFLLLLDSKLRNPQML